MRVLLTITIALALLIGCATSPDKMQAAYVSPDKYMKMDCDQLAAEHDRVTRRFNRLYTQLENEAAADEAQMAIGLVLFWPTLFFLEGGDGPEAAEYTQLKGDLNAIEQASIANRCGLQFQKPVRVTADDDKIKEYKLYPFDDHEGTP